MPQLELFGELTEIVAVARLITSSHPSLYVVLRVIQTALLAYQRWLIMCEFYMVNVLNQGTLGVLHSHMMK